jgi:hypothetical protein
MEHGRLAVSAATMGKLKKLVLGDRPFALSSHDINYYRDFALTWPLFVLSVAAFAYLSSPVPAPGERNLGYKFLGAAVVTVCLAKEKLVLIAATSVAADLA